jgi:hypothetical protein
MKRRQGLRFDIFDSDSSTAQYDVVKRPSVRHNTGSLPMYEKADLFPADAAALNKATQYDYKPTFLQGDDIYHFDEAQIRYQQAAGAFCGARNIVSQDIRPFTTRIRKNPEYYKFQDQHIVTVKSQAGHGFHAIDPYVRSTIQKQKVITTGAGNRMRADGFERDDNPKIFPQLPMGLPTSVEPMRPTSDQIRLNQTLVDPIATFPSMGF